MVLVATTSFAAVASAGIPSPRRLLPLLGAILLTQLAISIHNDYCDRDVDARSKPWRPIPRGLFAPAAAVRWTFALSAAGLAIAATLGPTVLALVAIGTGAGFVYNAFLSRTLWSWTPYWIGCTTLVPCAFAALDRLEPGLWIAYVVGAPIALVVNLTDSLTDVEADAAQGLRGLPSRLGPRGARLACWGSSLLAQVVAVLLWPGGAGPNPLFFASVGLLALAIAADRLHLARARWVASMLSPVALAVGWLMGFAG